MSDLDSKGGIEQQVVDGSEADTSPVSLPYPMTPGTYNGLYVLFMH